MVKNPKFLKNLLTTASAVALIGGFSTSAMAGTVKTMDADDAAFATGASWAPAGVVANGDSIIPTLVNAAAVVINGHMVGNSNTTVTINTNNVIDSRLSVGANTVGIAGVVGGKQLELRLTDDATRIILGLNGYAGAFAVPAEVGSYVGFNVIDFRNTDGIVTAATDGMTLGTDIVSTGGNKGHIVVAAKNVKFTGAFSAGGATKLQDLTVNDTASAIFDTDLVLATNLILGSTAAGTGTATIKTGKNVTLAAIVGSADGKGILNIEGGGTIVIGKTGTTKLETINLGAGLTHFKTIGGGGVNIKATNIKLLANDTVLRTSTNAANIQGIITTENANKGVIEIGVATTIDGAGTVVGTADKRLEAIKFVADFALNIGDGVNIYLRNDGQANTGIWTGVGGTGSIAFKGNATLDAVFTAKIGNIISANAVDKTVTFTNKVVATDVIVGGAAGGTMKFGDGLDVNSLRGGAAGVGIAEFNNTKLATVTLVDVTGDALQVAKISGSDLTFTNQIVKATTYAFGNQAVTVTVNNTTGANPDYSARAFTTESTTANQNFKFLNGDLTLGVVGANDKHFGTFSVDAGKRITVHAAAGANFFASVGGLNAKATFNAPAGRVDNIGAANAIMDEVSFTDDTEVFGDAYAKKISITTAKTGAFNKIVAGGGTVELINDATANFKDGSTLLNTLTATIDQHGIANVAGGGSIQNGVGASGKSLAELNFADKDGKTQSLGGDFYVDEVSFLKTIAQATNKKVTFYGVVDATDTTFDLGTAGITLANGKDSAIKGDTILKTTFNGTTNGLLTVDGAATKATLTDLKSLTVVLKDATSARRKSADPIRIINATGGAGDANFVDLGKVTPNGTMDPTGNKNVNWEFDEDTLTFVFNDVSDTRAKEAVAANGGTIQAQANIDKIYNAVAGTDAFALADEWSVLTTIDPKAEADASNRISSPVARTVSSAVNTALGQLGSVVTGRMQTLANPTAIRVTQADGVSAGAEDTLRYGAWGSPFYSQGVQKMRKGVSGYKSKTVGGTVGFDTMANDTMIVGVAATIAKTDLKHKDINAGDKTKADTLMFSIYGLQEINDDWFLQGVANFGSTKVKNTSKRIGAVNAQTATGKYDSMSWGGELLGGYNMNITSMAVITPMLGLDYTRTNDGGFTETGTRNQNLSVSKKSVDKTQLVAGVRAVMADIEQSGFVVTPEVHGFVRQALGSKNPKLTVKLDGAGELDTSNNAKLARTTGNLGLGINASSGMMSYGLTYDAHMAHKYVGHQGTFKVRVNF